MTAAGPNSSVRRTDTVLSELASAWVSVTGPDIFVLVILRLPALDRDRRILAHRVGREPVFERGQIDERLERRAGLAFGRDGAVELALGVALPADQRAHGAVRRHGDERALADAELFALLRQGVVERTLGRALQRRIDRGLDHDVLVEAADQVVDRVHHPIGDVIDRAGRRSA